MKGVVLVLMLLVLTVSANASFISIQSQISTELRENNLKVNVGGNTVVVKTIDETKKLLEVQSLEIREVHDQLIAQLKKIIEHAEKTEEELKGIVQDLK